MIRRVLLLPGQGIQHVGMIEQFERYPWSNEILKQVDDALGFSLSKMMKEGPESDLNLTEFAQPAIMVSSILHWTFLKHLYGAREDGFSFALGHSLGEYSACVISGALTVEQGAKLAYIRGKSMQEAVEGLAIRMSAVAASEETVRKSLNEVQIDGICEIAGVNHDKQVVLSGTRESVDLVTDHMKQKYKVPIKSLNVSAPFHCRLMKPAADRVKAELEKMDVKPAKIPVISNAHSKGLTDPNEIKQSLVDNITNPAWFLRGMEYCLSNGSNLFTEVGAKRVLTNIVNKIMKDRNLEGLILDLNEK
ncbi:fabD [Blepharisma stoltei]|uniref:[acyl-carrier-protein] S-malonyltransferase n=1 Tax=Blepharisma stoltei TaxID=1481888 RepID=A0AAU9J1D0_9CILI|nr:unnamed protein product [Blepharisma stoltei]